MMARLNKWYATGARDSIKVLFWKGVRWVGVVADIPSRWKRALFFNLYI
jgi:hypothetical protein